MTVSKMRQYLGQEPLGAIDGAWIVVDRNSWPIEALNDLRQWGQSDDRLGLGFYNPTFVMLAPTALRIQMAICRAKLRPTCSGKDWMNRPGTTTMVADLTKMENWPKCFRCR